tara:strand:- start:324 stop:509 length:186 start_codon:yes stop_codon:yes gene_type:complete
MTKKDYDCIARFLANYSNIKDDTVPKGELIKELTGIFERSNPLFDKYRFRKACDAYEGRLK